MRLSISIIKILKRDIYIQVISFITSILIARNLGPFVLGIWSILRLIQGYIETFGRTKTEFASIYFIGRKKFSVPDILKNLNLINFITSLLILLICFVNFSQIYQIFFSQADKNYKFELAILFLTIPFQFFYLSYLNVHIALENINIYNQMKSIYNSLFLLLNIINFSLFNLGVRSVIIVNLVSVFLSFLYGYICLPIKVRNSGNISKNITFSMFRYGLQFYLSSMLSELLQNSNKLVATSLLNPQFIGFLIQGDRFGGLLERIMAPLHTSIMPAISRSKTKDAIALVLTTFRISSLLLIFISLIIMLLIKPIILIFYGIEYSNIYKAVYFLLPGYYFLSISLILKAFFSGTGREIVHAYVQIIPIFIQFILSFLLINNFGFLGAAISFSLSMLLLLIIFVLYFFKTYKLNIVDLIINKQDLIIMKNILFNNILKKFTTN